MGELSLWGLALGPQCDTHGEQVWGWLAYPLVMLYCFFLLAQICDGHLTLALEFIVDRLKLSEDVAGATFLAMASSAPELFCSVVSTFVLVSASGVGNIVGSAVFNLLVIIGVTPLFAGSALQIWWYPTVRDAFFYFIAILEIILVMLDGLIYWWEGAIMVMSYAIYVCYFTQNQKICAHFGLEAPGQKEDEEAGNVEEKDAVAVSGSNAEITTAGTGEMEDVLSSGGSFTPNGTAGCAGSSTNAPAAVGFPSRLGRRLSSRCSNSSKNSCRQAGSQRSEAGTSSRPFTSLTKVVPSGAWDGAGCGGSGQSDRVPNAVEPAAEMSPNAAAQKEDEREEQHEAEEAAEKAQEAPHHGEPVQAQPSGSEQAASGGTPQVGALPSNGGIRSCFSEPIMRIIDLTMPTRPERLYTLFGLCCLWIGLFTYFAVDAAGRLGCLMSMPDVVMGLVFLAAGTSVPDAMGSIAVARSGMGDMAVANAVGSNTFDILIGLGLPWLLKGLVTQQPIEVPTESLRDAVVVLAACLVGYLLAIHYCRWKLTKHLGIGLLTLYAVVICWILVSYYAGF